MKKLLIIGGIVIVILAAAVIFVYTKDGSNGSATDPYPAQRLSVPAAAPEFSWAFAEAGSPDAPEGPMTQVSLITKGSGKSYDLGTHSGNCFVIEGSAWSRLPGEKTGAICWWAGGGTEIGVFEESGNLVVKTGPIDEGSEEEPGVRGNLTTLLEIN